MKTEHFYKFLLPAAAACSAGIGLEFLLPWLEIPAYLVPLPSSVAQVLQDDSGLLWEQFKTTALECVAGLGVSVCLGFLISIVIFSSQFFKTLLRPFLVVSQSVPYLTFAPLLLLWLGLGPLPKIVLVVLTCTFPIALAFEQGLQQARAEYEVVVAMLKLKPVSAIRHVYLPYALPHFFSGLKISVTYAFVSTVLAELIGSESGLGVYMTRAQSSYRTDRVVACCAVIVAASLALSFVVNYAEKRFVFWNTTKK